MIITYVESKNYSKLVNIIKKEVDSWIQNTNKWLPGSDIWGGGMGSTNYCV